MDHFVGISLLLFGVSLYLYYTIWLLVMPFVDVGHPFHDLFPPREYAIKVPIVILIILATTVLTFLSLVMINAGRKGL
jgi:dolichyl-phosphate mannosyltransferase polypeptide 2 regulatory subunit